MTFLPVSENWRNTASSFYCPEFQHPVAALWFSQLGHYLLIPIQNPGVEVGFVKVPGSLLTR